MAREKTWEEKMAEKAAERRKVVQQEEYERGQREMEDEQQIAEPAEGYLGWWA